jgi:hypothetical protein
VTGSEEGEVGKMKLEIAAAASQQAHNGHSSTLDLVNDDGEGWRWLLAHSAMSQHRPPLSEGSACCASNAHLISYTLFALRD